jgi:hypothetical protein
MKAAPDPCELLDGQSQELDLVRTSGRCSSLCCL